MGWRGFGHSFPPDIAIIGQGYIGKDRIAANRGHRVGIRLVRSAGGDAKETCFWIDRIDLAIGAGLDPGNIVTNRRDFPAILLKSLGRNQHGEISLATGARESRSDIGLPAVWLFHPEDQHMFGQPALLFGQDRRNPQGKTFLAE